jgi:hypothetical protein
MKKKYLSLTQEQKARGVIFSSQLVPNGMIHEVLQGEIGSVKDQRDANEKIERLLNDKFFNDSHYKYNEIRQ